jgi:hypothetical protein
MNSQREMENMVPSEAAIWKDADASGAYNCLKIHPDSEIYQGVYIMGKIYVYMVAVGSQALSCWFTGTELLVHRHDMAW